MNPDYPTDIFQLRAMVAEMTTGEKSVTYKQWGDILNQIYGKINTSKEHTDKDLWKQFLKKGIDTVAILVQEDTGSMSVDEYFDWYDRIHPWMALLDRMIEPTAGTDNETIKELLNEIIIKIIKPLAEKEKGYEFKPPAQSPSKHLMSLVKRTMDVFIKE